METYIIGIPSRQQSIDSLSQKLNIKKENIILDTTKSGPLASEIKALKKETKESHILFLQDDAWPCDNFYEICDRIIKTHDDKIIGLFPFDFVFDDIADEAIRIKNDSPYYEVGIMSAVGIIFPTKYANSFIEYANKYGMPFEDDKTILRFCEQKKIGIIQTFPALVQHLGTKSTIWSSATERKMKYFENQSAANWESKVINKIPSLPLLEPPEFCKKSLEVFARLCK